MTLHLFEAYGIELEYMIVDEDLNVLPIADKVFREVLGHEGSDMEEGPIHWSNELALHVIELKTGTPTDRVDLLAEQFASNITRINKILAPHGGRIMPTAAHPWMDPLTETHLWTHESGEVYQAYDRIFSCKGHGWSNLQSTHINLPFSGDEEFHQLHAAVRILLPIIPALAASSPILDGTPTGMHDTRMKYYRFNQRSVPEATGQVIPEPIASIAEYEEKILEPLYEAIKPHDPDGILQHEWLNSRGATARFSRGSIEIRVMDIQECPLADIAMADLIIRSLQHLVNDEWSTADQQDAVSTERLAAILNQASITAEKTIVDDLSYLALLGLKEPCTMRDIIEHLCQLQPAGHYREAIEHVIAQGSLATRILEATGPTPDRQRLQDTYASLIACCTNNTMFSPDTLK